MSRRILHFAFPRSLQAIIICATVLGVSSACAAPGHATESAATESGAKAASGPEIRGVELGQYRIRTYYPVDAQKSTVRFTLYAAIKNERFAETQRLVDEHRQKLRDQVITATRLAPLAAFQEPDLAAFRRRVLVRLRRAIPELSIDDLYVSDFDLSIKSL